MTISYEEVVKLLDKEYELVQADYRDSLDGGEEYIQKAIHAQDLFLLEEELLDDTWYSDVESNGVDYVLEQLKDEITSTLNVEDEEVDEFMDEYASQLAQEIRERDRSTYFDDVLRHSNNPICFYDTGYQMPEGSWAFNEKEMAQYLKEVKKALRLKIKDTTWDRKLEIMIGQASYGGQLVVYFEGNIKELTSLAEKKYTQIVFENAHVAIIDTVNGSGDDTQLPGAKIALPLEIKNIFLDKTMHYSYTYDVCGMFSYWCQDTVVSFRKTIWHKPIKLSPINDILAQQICYEEIFKKGGCVQGDMDIVRHRDVYYENNFPCGSHCPHCGNFWID